MVLQSETSEERGTSPTVPSVRRTDLKKEEDTPYGNKND